MTTEQPDHLKYPIGKYRQPDVITDELIYQWIAQIEALPAKLRHLVSKLNEKQLNTAYRPEGWTVRQVIHHVPDSHVNGYVRFKWSLTEDKPVIKAYNERAWAELSDAKSAPIELSLAHLDALHIKWVYLLHGLSKNDLERTFIHPETHKETPLKAIIGLYAWHGEHHYMHIKNLMDRNKWFQSTE